MIMSLIILNDHRWQSPVVGTPSVGSRCAIYAHRNTETICLVNTSFNNTLVLLLAQKLPKEVHRQPVRSLSSAPSSVLDITTNAYKIQIIFFETETISYAQMLTCNLHNNNRMHITLSKTQTDCETSDRQYASLIRLFLMPQHTNI